MRTSWYIETLLLFLSSPGPKPIVPKPPKKPNPNQVPISSKTQSNLKGRVQTKHPQPYLFHHYRNASIQDRQIYFRNDQIHDFKEDKVSLNWPLGLTLSTPSLVLYIYFSIVEDNNWKSSLPIKRTLCPFLWRKRCHKWALRWKARKTYSLTLFGFNSLQSNNIW